LLPAHARAVIPEIVDAWIRQSEEEVREGVVGEEEELVDNLRQGECGEVVNEIPPQKMMGELGWL